MVFYCWPRLQEHALNAKSLFQFNSFQLTYLRLHSFYILKFDTYKSPLNMIIFDRHGLEQTRNDTHGLGDNPHAYHI